MGVYLAAILTTNTTNHERKQRKRNLNKIMTVNDFAGYCLIALVTFGLALLIWKTINPLNHD